MMNVKNFVAVADWSAELRLDCTTPRELNFAEFEGVPNDRISSGQPFSGGDDPPGKMPVRFDTFKF